VDDLQGLGSVTGPLQTLEDGDASAPILNVVSEVAPWHVLKDDAVFGGVPNQLHTAVMLSRESGHPRKLLSRYLNQRDWPTRDRRLNTFRLIIPVPPAKAANSCGDNTGRDL
jgi:hypothetical protein